MKNILAILLAVFIYQSIFAQTDTSVVLLTNIDSTIVQDVKYATKDNFTKQILYPTAKVYLRAVVAKQLSLANKYLKNKYNLLIKIYDGYRPHSVQKQMWEVFPNPNFVADPKVGSKHNRGAAVDITLVDLKGNELDMGTTYDTFSKKAHFKSGNISTKARKNRDLLRDVMQQFGFKGISTEWWHFDYKDWKKFSILDVRIN